MDFLYDQIIRNIDHAYVGSELSVLWVALTGNHLMGNPRAQPPQVASPRNVGIRAGLRRYVGIGQMKKGKMQDWYCSVLCSEETSEDVMFKLSWY